jgi:HNH endonuclease
MSRGTISNMQRMRGLPCHYCETVATTADHVVPLAKGGTDALWNLVPACGPCNQAKADQLPGCGCEFCVRALAFWRDPDLPRPEPKPRIRPREHSWPLPMSEVDKLQAWLDRHMPGQTV